MHYVDLADFIVSRMRMAHIYQPVVLISLLEHGGRRHERELALDLLCRDESQIEYYSLIAKNMVGRVLRRHGIIKWDKSSKEFSLPGYDSLTDIERKRLIQLCKEKLADFIERRGTTIFSHRRKSSGYISGTLRYEVLKLAKYRCELCGISADEKALEVDHIIPRNKGGQDDLSNLQALCYSCNAMKRDRDDTDFRDVRKIYSVRQSGCPFCEISPKRIIAENELAFVVKDSFPVTDGHSLIIPKRHIESYFELGRSEFNAVNQLLLEEKTRIQKADQSVSGFNVGFNAGSSAGQTVFHCHVHVIPRRDHDTENPRGGVRRVIPGKGDYSAA